MYWAPKFQVQVLAIALLRWEHYVIMIWLVLPHKALNKFPLQRQQKEYGVKKSDVVRFILNGRPQHPMREVGLAFAPTNIALCKYWGKRDAELNLPVTSSL